MPKNNRFSAQIAKVGLTDQLQRRDYLKAYKRNKKSGIPHPKDAPSLKEIDNLLQDIENQIEKTVLRNYLNRILQKRLI